MGAFIQQIATAVPDTVYAQDMLREQMKRYLGGDRRTQAILHRVYSQSGIKQRHSVVDDFTSASETPLFFNGTDSPHTPSTGKRNQIYEQKAKPLFIEAGRKTLQQANISPHKVTHVITVSCTGFFAPGPDYHLLRELDLNPDIHRFHLGFMGCFAAFPAINMANAFCEADPNAVVLIVGVELCTLHFQNEQDTDNIIAGSVFADGAAGVLVSKRPISDSDIYFSIDQLHTQVTPKGEQDMAWTIGDTGFRMKLSTYVPDIIESNLDDVIQPLLRNSDHLHTTQNVVNWAIHPGGRAILDKVQQALDLNEEQLKASRNILAEFGNMSSVTILFVLKEILAQKMTHPLKPEPTLAMAFGPGLTVESGLLTKMKNPFK